MRGCDMIAGLYTLPEMPVSPTIKIVRAFVGDKEKIMSFIGEHFNQNWKYEAEQALLGDISRCFLAVENGKILGFACYDASAKGFFGPIGIDPARRGEKIGEMLLLRTLNAMKEAGYAYAIIGWVDSAENFYRKTVHAEWIPNGTPDKSVYSNLVALN